MESDLELDLFEISDDKLKSFLTSKLEEIRLENEVLNALLFERQQAITSSQIPVQQDIQIVNQWKTIFNHKYALGFEIATTEPITDIRLVLSNSSKQNLQYTVQIFSASPSEKCRDSHSCPDIICGFLKKFQQSETKNIFIVVCLEMPQFLCKLTHELFAHLICCNLNGQEVNLPLPMIEISAKDYVLVLNERNSLQNLVSMISCSDMIDLVLCLPKGWTSSVVSTFEIHCSLTFCHLAKDKSYFVANKISELFDNTFLIVHNVDDSKNEVFFKVFTANDDKLFRFLHHILLCLPNSNIFPHIFYESYKINQKNVQLDELKVSMRVDLEQSYYFAKMTVLDPTMKFVGNEKFKLQSEKLHKQETKTDLLYLSTLKH